MAGEQKGGKRAGMDRLTIADVQEIRREAAAGTSHKAIAERFGVCKALIADIQKGRQKRIKR